MSSSGRTTQNNNNKKKNVKCNEEPPKISSSSASEEEEEVKSSNNSNQNVNEDEKKEKNNSRKNKDDTGVGSCCFPTNRINRIIRSEGADFRITQESIFLINKATEQFLEVLCEDVYAKIVRDRRKVVDYKLISFAVAKGKRYDFLSDFVPEKIRAEDALSERLTQT